MAIFDLYTLWDFLQQDGGNRSSPSIDDIRITENEENRITENGDTRMLE